MATLDEVLVFELSREKAVLSNGLTSLIDNLTAAKTKLDTNDNPRDIDHFLARDLAELLQRAAIYRAKQYVLAQLRATED